MTRAAKRCIWLLLLALPAVAHAQDTTPPREGVRVGITYQPGVRPGMLVLGGVPGERVDSLRAIVTRDLDYSDQYEIITVPSEDSVPLGIGSGPSGTEFVNYRLYAALGADFSVRIRELDQGVVVTVYDVRGETIRRELAVSLPSLDDPGFRMAVHRMSDDIVRACIGQLGIAATRFLFLQHGRIYRVDADGADLEAVSPAGVRAFSPAWSPDGHHVAYSEFHDPGARIVIQEFLEGMEISQRMPRKATGFRRG